MALAVTAAELSYASPAAAREQTFRFDLPAAPPAATLTAIAQASGVAIGWSTLPAGAKLRAVRGTLSVAAALRRALGGSGLAARQVGPTAWMVETAARTAPRSPPASPRTISPSSQNTAPLPDIVVTARKRAETLGAVAGSLDVVRPAAALPGRIVPGTRDVATTIDGLAVTNLGPGRNRAFIRGVADSPFNGASQSTVAVVLDEARVTFDAPDPDLRLVDVEQVEVLKGPQGPLYGSGALGGIYRIVTRKPDLESFAGSVQAVVTAMQHGAAGGGGEAMLNVPLIDGTLGLRAVGYAAHDGGWIDNLGGRHNANDTSIAGGRVALRWRPDARWTIDLSGVVQDVNPHDSQYVTASDDTIQRQARIREPSDNDFRSAALTVNGTLGGFAVTGASSYVRHDISQRYDSSDAAAAFGFAGATRFDDKRRYSIENYELRVAPLGSARWIAGVSYLAAFTASRGTMTGADRSAVVERRDRRVAEVAAFGEYTVPLSPHLDALIGARASYTQAEDATGGRDVVERDPRTARRIGKPVLSPSLALTWSTGWGDTLYARYARAVRPGGLAQSADGAASDVRRFDADELGTIDIGYRWRPGRRLSGTLSVFNTVWTDIQSDYLLDDGLVSTRNAGTGHIYGVEASGDWKPGPATTLSAGIAYVDARLVRSAARIRLEDTRLPVTPDLTGRVTLRQAFTVGRWDGFALGQLNYVGHARLSFDPDLDRRMGGYLTGSLGAFLSRGKLTLGARLDNPFDVKGDSFAFGNPFSIRTERQYTPLQPRSLSLSLARAW